MKVLGITGTFTSNYHDATAALVEDGRVVCVQHEERISRVKHSIGTPMPYKAIDQLLRSTGLSLRDIDLITSAGCAHVNHAARMQRFYERKYGDVPPIELYDHHLCHSALAYYGSGFDRSVIWTSDYSGEECSGLISVGNEGSIHNIQRFKRTSSLGVLYGAVTQYLGFEWNSDEGKVMGLSAFADKPIDLTFLVEWSADGGFELNSDFFEEPPRLDGPPCLRTEELYSKQLPQRLGMAPRLRGEPISQSHARVAAGLQELLYACVARLLENHVRLTGAKKLCLAGGTALNVLCNHRICESLGIEQLYVPPMPGDDGISIGSAYLAHAKRSMPIHSLDNPFLGTSFDDAMIANVLAEVGVGFRRLDNPSRHAAESLASGDIIAWFQGAAECGPRALGNRSILADPRQSNVRDKINRAVKYREIFRPFAPATIQEVANQYFADCYVAPFMSRTYTVRQQYRAQIPAVTHHDGTARVQIVNPTHNPRFYSLIEEFGHITGITCVLNTSFNTNGQPLVDGPHDAISTFFSSSLSKLYIGSFLVEKPQPMPVAIHISNYTSKGGDYVGGNI